MVSQDNTMHLIDKSQYEGVKLYLEQYLPDSASLLLWLSRTVASQIAGLDQFSLYCTQPQLTAEISKEPVVIIAKQIDRVRIFVSTEAELNEANPVWVGEDDIGLENGDFRFSSKGARDIYESSKKSLKNAIGYGAWNMDEIFFHGVSLLWCPVIYQMFSVPYNGPCETYICPAEQILHKELLKTISVKGEQLSIDSVNEQEYELIMNSNKISYDIQYVTECCQISTVIRGPDGNMVAWAFTHSDGAVGALHVLPDWRRLGLAQVVVQNLCVKQAQAFMQLLEPHQIYLKAIIENFNITSKSMFQKLGWTKSGVGITWIKGVAK